MIQNWYDPFTAGELWRRIFSFLNLGVLFITLAFGASEFRFDWCERLVGTYLLTTNDTRPETGAVWESGRQTSNAHKSLNQIITRREDTRRSAQSAESFSHLAGSLRPGEWVPLDKDLFKVLYLSLSASAGRKVIDPSHLVWLLNGKTTDRIFCEGQADGVKLYFIDSQNRVIHQIDLKKNAIVEIESGNAPLKVQLKEIEAFAGRIFPAEKFFDAVLKLPTEMISELMVDPDLLLKQNGTIQQVGIWNEAENGYIKLGFEFEYRGENQVLLIQAREWAVWQLSLLLKAEPQ
ncbi:MAG: hypothetical protein KKF12_19045 [Proteobacteria bacterium]|nr:hypothetical protein [Desulfobacula sp.]MBU3954548.1 hypothetical protein [Pseudomonadota bacterium]MBU4132921.1 hypothetical protein [Pseudomonadota bacterium]